MRRPGGPLLWAFSITLALMAGCNAPGQPTFRFGSLPFPGLALFNRADPDRLGMHRYWSPTRIADGEVGRGIIYTYKAGFLDVSHVRDAADWSRYLAMHVEPALEARRPSLTLGGPDRSRIHMSFNYPHGWDDLPTFQRRQLIHELAMRCGQEASYALWTWHELITWYGYATVPPFSESPSSFTYDDVMSHVIGLYVFERAWSDPGRDYNQATTLALDQVIHELEPASPQETAEAVEAVRGWWWQRGRALKRHLDVGLEDGEVTPMLIGRADPEESKSPQRFGLPRASDVEAAELDLSSFLLLELESRTRIYARLREQLPGEPQRLVPERDFPPLLANVRREMQRQIGPDVDSLGDAPSPAAALRNRQSRG